MRERPASASPGSLTLPSTGALSKRGTLNYSYFGVKQRLAGLSPQAPRTHPLSRVPWRRSTTTSSAARHRDERAYAAVVTAQALPKENEAQRLARRVALESALHEAAESPLHGADLTLDVLRLTARLVESPRGALASDVGCAAELAYAGLAACAYNVRVNHHYMHDDAAIADQSARLDSIEREGAQLVERVRGAL